MKTSRILLRLLLVVGSLILLLDARHPGLATYSAQCGYYPPVTGHNCPSPCEMKYYTFTWQTDGPFYIAIQNYEWCDTGSEGCSSATGVSSPSRPEKSTACGCGGIGQWCEDDPDCCANYFCIDNSCATCIPDGYTGCDTNADCCDNLPCTCYGFCGCDGEGDDCCTNADCCSAYVCTDGTCQSSGGGGGGGGGGCSGNDDCPPDRCCNSGNCGSCEGSNGIGNTLDEKSSVKPVEGASANAPLGQAPVRSGATAGRERRKSAAAGRIPKVGDRQ